MKIKIIKEKDIFTAARGKVHFLRLSNMLRTHVARVCHPSHIVEGGRGNHQCLYPRQTVYGVWESLTSRQILLAD